MALRMFAWATEKMELPVSEMWKNEGRLRRGESWLVWDILSLRYLLDIQEKTYMYMPGIYFIKLISYYRENYVFCVHPLKVLARGCDNRGNKPMENRFLRGKERKVFRVSWPNPRWAGYWEKNSHLDATRLKWKTPRMKRIFWKFLYIRSRLPEMQSAWHQISHRQEWRYII